MHAALLAVLMVMLFAGAVAESVHRFDGNLGFAVRAYTLGVRADVRLTGGARLAIYCDAGAPVLNGLIASVTGPGSTLDIRGCAVSRAVTIVDLGAGGGVIVERCTFLKATSFNVSGGTDIGPVDIRRSHFEKGVVVQLGPEAASAPAVTLGPSTVLAITDCVFDGARAVFRRLMSADTVNQNRLVFARNNPLTAAAAASEQSLLFENVVNMDQIVVTQSTFFVTATPLIDTLTFRSLYNVRVVELTSLRLDLRTSFVMAADAFQSCIRVDDSVLVGTLYVADVVTNATVSAEGIVNSFAVTKTQRVGSIDVLRFSFAATVSTSDGRGQAVWFADVDQAPSIVFDSSWMHCPGPKTSTVCASLSLRRSRVSIARTTMLMGYDSHGMTNGFCSVLSLTAPRDLSDTLPAVGEGVELIVTDSRLDMFGSYKVRGVAVAGNDWLVSVQRSFLRCASNGQGGHVVYPFPAPYQGSGAHRYVNTTLELVDNEIELMSSSAHQWVSTAVVFYDRYLYDETSYASSMKAVRNNITLTGTYQHRIFKPSSTNHDTHYFMAENVIVTSRSIELSTDMSAASSTGSSQTFRCNTMSFPLTKPVVNATTLPCGACDQAFDCDPSVTTGVSSLAGLPANRCGCTCGAAFANQVSTAAPAQQCRPIPSVALREPSSVARTVLSRTLEPTATPQLSADEIQRAARHERVNPRCGQAPSRAQPVAAWGPDPLLHPPPSADEPPTVSHIAGDRSASRECAVGADPDDPLTFRFNYIEAMAMAPDGDALLADTKCNCIWRLERKAPHRVTVFAGAPFNSGNKRSTMDHETDATQGTLSLSHTVDVDGAGDVLISQDNTGIIRKVTTNSGRLSTWYTEFGNDVFATSVDANNGIFARGLSDDVKYMHPNRSSTLATIYNNPDGLAATAVAPDGTVYIGSKDGATRGLLSYSPRDPETPPTRLLSGVTPRSISVDGNGGIIFCDDGASIERYDPASGARQTIVTSAQLGGTCFSVIVARDGTLVVSVNVVAVAIVRSAKVAPFPDEAPCVRAWLNASVPPDLLDRLAALDVLCNDAATTGSAIFPAGIPRTLLAEPAAAWDPLRSSPRPATPQHTAFAGRGTAALYVNAGPPLSAAFNEPQGVAFDHRGNLLVADRGSHIIRTIDRDTRFVSYIAGEPFANGTADSLDQPFRARFESPQRLLMASYPGADRSGEHKMLLVIRKASFGSSNQLRIMDLSSSARSVKTLVVPFAAAGSALAVDRAGRLIAIDGASAQLRRFAHDGNGRASSAEAVGVAVPCAQQLAVGTTNELFVASSCPFTVPSVVRLHKYQLEPTANRSATGVEVGVFEAPVGATRVAIDMAVAGDGAVLVSLAQTTAATIELVQFRASSASESASAAGVLVAELQTATGFFAVDRAGDVFYTQTKGQIARLRTPPVPEGVAAFPTATGCGSSSKSLSITASRSAPTSTSTRTRSRASVSPSTTATSSTSLQTRTHSVSVLTPSPSNSLSYATATRSPRTRSTSASLTHPLPVRAPTLKASLVTPTNEAAATSAAVTSAAAGSPAGAVMASRLDAVGALASCGEPSAEVSRASSPLQLAPTGDAATTYHVGTVLGNALLIGGFAGVQVALAGARVGYERLRFGRPLEWGVACEFARFPSQLAFPALLLGPPTAMSAFVVLGRTTTRWAQALAAAFLLATALGWAWVGRQLGTRGRFGGVYVRTDGTKTVKRADGALEILPLRRRITRWLAERGEWRDHKAHRGFVARHALLFADYRGDVKYARHFLLFEAGVSYVLVALVAASTAGFGDEASCRVLPYLTLLLLLAHTVAVVEVAPFTSGFLHAVNVLFSLGQLASGVLGVVSQLTTDPATVEALNVVGLGISFGIVAVSLALAAWDVYMFVRTVLPQAVQGFKRITTVGGDGHDDVGGTLCAPLPDSRLERSAPLLLPPTADNATSAGSGSAQEVPRTPPPKTPTPAKDVGIGDFAATAARNPRVVSLARLALIDAADPAKAEQLPASPTVRRALRTKPEVKARAKAAAETCLRHTGRLPALAPDGSPKVRRGVAYDKDLPTDIVPVRHWEFEDI